MKRDYPYSRLPDRNRLTREEVQKAIHTMTYDELVLVGRLTKFAPMRVLVILELLDRKFSVMVIAGALSVTESSIFNVRARHAKKPKSQRHSQRA